MHIGDSIFIFVMALVLFGPKKLPEIGRQVGKLLAEFRKASNEFKFQIQEEIRNMEEEERRKKLAETQAQTAANPPGATNVPSILPPSTGMPVSATQPFATPGPPIDPLPVTPDLALNSAALVAETPAFAETEAKTEAAVAPEVNAGAAPVPPDAHANGAHFPMPETEQISHG